MVVIASMVGAKGLGSSVSRNSTERHCKGFESGLGIVILAIILDRTTQAIAKK
jgi:glycine betaine/proline transport system permease protein